MFRTLSLILVACAATTVAPAATLRQLSLPQVAASATAVVHARVTGSYASFSGPTIYTHYKLQISETWKGSPVTEVMLPGGVAKGLRQSFPGVPALQTGSDYVLFLWTSTLTGITHVVGLNQGIFDVTLQSDGTPQASRPRIGEAIYDASGNAVQDHAIQMKLADLRAVVGQ
ncbi:MAG TPA: hypothetical protein VG273_01815 [Bryobacteraceae bacterium]|jgi:hypothetical protein|nr:hypothetical protein [Bryobacteraceae bacterium]